MFKTFINAFKIKEVRNKLLFTFLMLLIIRFGCQISAPGVDQEFVKSAWASLFSLGGAEGYINAFTGGSLMQMSIFALNITPYITSSIIMQLMTIAIPKLEEMQREGEDGRKKMATITRYVTVGLAVVEAGMMAIGFGGQGLLENYNVLNVIAVIVAMTAGSTFLMWIGERINEKGVGNGISIILAINIISSFPQDVMTLYEKFIKGKTVALAVLAAAIILVVVIAMIVLVIYLSNGTRKIPVQYAKKVQGHNRMMGGNSSVIPVRINTAGVIPVIFASSILTFPIIISNMLKFDGTGWWGECLKYLNSNFWFNPEQFKYTIGLILYVVLVVFFAYFYTSITFNPIEMANNMKKQGGFIPGIRPGTATVEYLARIVSRLGIVGAIFLAVIATLPTLLQQFTNLQIGFGGTSLLIAVGVALETMKQLETQMTMRNYNGFLK